VEEVGVADRGVEPDVGGFLDVGPAVGIGVGVGAAGHREAASPGVRRWGERVADDGAVGPANGQQPFGDQGGDAHADGGPGHPELLGQDLF
jgi:hypothetical protein